MKCAQCLLVMILASCGTGAADEDFEAKPLAMINGWATNDAAVKSHGPIGAALVWLSQGENQILNVVQNTPITSDFPARFQLAIASPPPLAAMRSEPDAPPYAWASIVIYQDDNGNGTLDTPQMLNERLPETILGVRQLLFVVYVEGGPMQLGDSLGGGTVPSGFSLMDLSDVAASRPAHISPIDAEFEIALSAQPKLPDAICFMLSSVDDSAPVAEEIVCAEDNRSYYVRYIYSTDPQSAAMLCPGESRSLGYRIPDGEPAPEGWPCSET